MFLINYIVNYNVFLFNYFFRSLLISHVQCNLVYSAIAYPDSRIFGGKSDWMTTVLYDCRQLDLMQKPHQMDLIGGSIYLLII